MVAFHLLLAVTARAVFITWLIVLLVSRISLQLGTITVQIWGSGVVTDIVDLSLTLGCAPHIVSCVP